MAIFSVSGVDERIYFNDYLGYSYKADTGVNDKPTNTITAVSSYFYTNWKPYQDICDQKGVPHTYIYHSQTDGTLHFSYSWDFSEGDEYTQSFSMATTRTVSDLGVRRDLTGRGRVVRFKFENTASGTHYVIHGLGTQVNLQTKA